MKRDESQMEVRSKQQSQKKNVLQKSKLIELLEQKNNDLFKEVQRITKIVSDYDKKPQQKPNQNPKSVLLRTANDPDILEKQLKNCYKQIKIYQYEVEKLKSKTLSVELSDKMMAANKQLKQKKQIQNRLKQQLNSITKEVADNSKKLSDNNHQQEMEKQYKSKLEELRVLKQKIKDCQTKESIKQKNLKQEYTHIKNLQKQYMQNGGAVSELQNIKRKALSQFQEGRLVKKQIKIDTQDMKMSMIKSSAFFDNSSINDLTNNVSSMEINIARTKANYENMLNELGVLEKLNKKYQKQFEESDKIIIEFQGKSQLKKLRLERLQKEIQELNASIKLKKTCIVPENMKPTHRKLSVRSVNVRQDIGNISQVRQHNKRRRNIINMTSIMGDRQQRLYHN